MLILALVIPSKVKYEKKNLMDATKKLFAGPYTHADNLYLTHADSCLIWTQADNLYWTHAGSCLIWTHADNFLVFIDVYWTRADSKL